MRQDREELLLAAIGLAECLVRPPPLGDIADHDHDTHDPALVVLDRGRVLLDATAAGDRLAMKSM